VSELKSVRKVRVDADFGDTARSFGDIDVELDSVEEILGLCDHRKGIWTYWGRDLMVITACETRVLRIPNTPDDKTERAFPANVI
jgi:hypothetical protein